MKKLWEAIKDKAIAAIVGFMLTTGVVFLWNAGKEIWYLPSTVKELKLLHTRDSIKASLYVSKIDSLQKITWRHSRKLSRDSVNIQAIKTKLKMQ